jgi:hypothetical protein
VDSSLYQSTSTYSELPTTSQYLPVQPSTPSYVAYPEPMPSFSVQQMPALTVSDYAIEGYPQMSSSPYETAPSSSLYSEAPMAEPYSQYEHSQDEDSGNGLESIRATKLAKTDEISERKFQCSYSMCPMRFKRRRDLSRHETSVHRNERMYICDGTLSETDSRLKHCQCGRAFNRKDNLRNHLKPRTGRLSSASDDNPTQQ